MSDEEQLPQSTTEELQHLKRVSQIKHIILQKYLPGWTRILASKHPTLAYFDCFAGPGRYELQGRTVPGSPVIAVKEAIDFLRDRPHQNLVMYLIDDDPKQVRRLETGLEYLKPYPKNLEVNVKRADSRSFIPNLLGNLPLAGPSFFLIDPYGHPLPVPVINRILRRQHTEALINLMWFRINMDISNPVVGQNVDDFFGGAEWREQPFINMHGPEREKTFLKYFQSQLDCKFLLPFKIRYDVEDTTGGDRTKYYLLHVSNHVKAVLLMKEVMWPLGDEEGTFDFSGQSQGVLISMTPTPNELEEILLREFKNREIGFDELRERTWILPFIEKHYREVLKRLEGTRVRVRRITSKRTGIKGEDRIRFL
jgi:three-Cys-motif partner protein